MEKSPEKKIIKKKFPIWHFLIALGIEIALLFGYFWLVGLFSDTTINEIYKHLSDGFLVTGLLAFGIGLLIYVSNQGGFNFLSFAALKLVSKFVHKMKITTMSYGDYLESKKQGEAQYGYLLIIGGVFLVACIVFIVLFYQAGGANYPR